MTISQIGNLFSSEKNNSDSDGENNTDKSVDVPTSFKYISLGIILILLIFFFGAFLWKTNGN